MSYDRTVEYARRTGVRMSGPSVPVREDRLVRASAQGGVDDVLRSAGSPLANRERWQMTLGHDFSSMRVHADSDAAASAQSLRAAAYTVGEHVAFGVGRYQPSTPEGRQLIAHELAHVVQQRRGGAVPSDHPGSPSELAADTVSAAVAAQRVGINVPGATGVGLARQTDPRHARGYAGEQGMGFGLYPRAEGWIFVDGPGGSAGHGVTTSGFDGVAYNVKTAELDMIDNKSLRTPGPVRSASAIDRARTLATNVDKLITKVEAAKDMPGRIAILAKLRQTRAALAGNKPLPPGVKLVATTVGGQSTGVSPRLRAAGVTAHPSTPTAATPSTLFDEKAAIEGSKAVQAYRARKAAPASSAPATKSPSRAGPSAAPLPHAPTAPAAHAPAPAGPAHLTSPSASAASHLPAAEPHMAPPHLPAAEPHMAPPHLPAAEPHMAPPHLPAAEPHMAPPSPTAASHVPGSPVEAGLSPHSSVEPGVGEAVGEAAAQLIQAVGSMIIQAKWVDPQNEAWLQSDLVLRQPAINARLAALQPQINSVRAAGKPAYANVTIDVDYQGDPETGLVFYAGMVGDVKVAIGDHDISGMEEKKQGFWETLGNQLVNRSHMVLKVSYLVAGPQQSPPSAP